jgi:hypothetical protein
MYQGKKVELYAFLVLTLDGSEWSASRYCGFSIENGIPNTSWIGLKPVWAMGRREKIVCFRWESIPMSYRITWALY